MDKTYVTMYSNSSADTTLLVAPVVVGVWGNNLYKCARSYNRKGYEVERKRAAGLTDRPLSERITRVRVNMISPDITEQRPGPTAPHNTPPLSRNHGRRRQRTLGAVDRVITRVVEIEPADGGHERNCKVRAAATNWELAAERSASSLEGAALAQAIHSAAGRCPLAACL